jgi:nucleoside-diphosphate-sugar epimerase
MEGVHPRVPMGEPGHRQILGEGAIHLGDVCLVTGGAGFIGSALVRGLVQQGMRVRVYDDLSTGRASNLDGIDGEVELVQGDVRDRESLWSATQGAAVVFHLAAATSASRSVTDPLQTHEVNATGAMNMLLGARDAGCQRVVVASSASVYGDQDPGPLRESLPTWPMSPFAASKLAAERYATAFFYAYALQSVSLRLFNVFGPREAVDGEGGVVASFIGAALQGRSFEIHGDGEQSRDFVHVGDVVQAMLLAADATPDAFGGVFNIGMGDRHTVAGLARLITRLAEGIGVNPLSPPRHVPAREGDLAERHADIREAARVLGFSPEYGFEEGLRRTVAWFAEQRHTQP